MPNKEFAILTALLFCVYSEEFNCTGHQPNCFWIRKIPSNWYTAYADCTLSGGSLISSDYFVSFDDWISKINNSSDVKVWSSLHRINHRFQVLHNPYPQFRLGIDWLPGHPFLQWSNNSNCVVVNRNRQHENVNCNDSFPIICGISYTRMKERRNLDIPQVVLEVKLTVDENFTSRIRANHLEIDANETNLAFTCDVRNNGTRMVEYSWIKDGVFLEENVKSDLILSEVKDKSKSTYMDNKDPTYQKQGTYQCQVKEFGAVNFSTSNAIVLTHSRVMNGIVTIRTSSRKTSDKFMNYTNVMNTLRNFVHQNILKEELRRDDINTVLWDPLFNRSIVDQNAEEYRSSLYIEIPTQNYSESELFNLLDAVSMRVENNFTLNSHPGKISIAWATYCPTRKQAIRLPSLASDPIEIIWPNSWTAAIVKPQKIILCVHETNRVEQLTGKCFANFTYGASIVVDIKNECQRVVTQVETHRCRYGYHWIEEIEACYKITENGSWNETIATCMNDWPDMDGVDNIIHHTVISFLQTGDKLKVDVWLPIRRSSIFGHFHYYSVNHDPAVISRTGMIENLTAEFMDEECLILERNGTTRLSHCSVKTIPGVCVYRPNSKGKFRNLCPQGWYGNIIQQGRLTCFSIITNESLMTWKAAEHECLKKKDNFGTTVNVSMATFENYGKTQHWNTVRSNFASELNSTGSDFWIGLRWSEIHKKFCWFGSDIECKFEHFNWEITINWAKGYYGIMNDSGSWNLLSNSSRRKHVLCQAEIDLDVIQTIRIHHKPNDNVLLEMVAHQSRAIPQSFTNLSDFFSSKSSTLNVFANLELEGIINVNYYLDGEMGEKISKFPFEFSLQPSFSIAKIFICEGWMGWPRRFFRSEPIIVLRPPESLIFLVMLDANRQELKSKGKDSIDFRPEPVGDIKRRLKTNIPEFDFNVTGNVWTYGEQMRVLVRVVITKKKRKQLHQNWKELLRNAFLFPSSGQLSYQVVYIRNIDACEQENITVLSADGVSNAFNLSWNSVAIGLNSEPINPCQANGHPILRKCIGNLNTGAFWEPFTLPINSNCAPATDLLNSLRKLTKEVVTDITPPSSALHNLTEIVTKHKLSGVELGEAARILHASVQRIVGPLEEQQFNETLQTLTMMIATPDELQQAQLLTGVSNALVKSLEQVMRQVSIENGNDTVTFPHSKITTESMFGNAKVVGYGANVNKELEILNGMRILDKDTESLVEELVSKDVAIVLPIGEIRKQKELDNGTSLRLSFTILANADLFDAQRNTIMGSANFVVDSPVIIAQVGNSSLSNLTKPVRVFFRSRSEHNLSIVPVCVFWDTLSISGGWSPSGCQFKGRTNDDGLYICECNHLTPLALLFPYFDKMDETHKMALSLISNIGCVASMVGLFLVILTFLLFRKWRKSLGNKILFNFALALFCLTGCFLSAGLLIFDDRLCKTAAAAMHYFLLSSFSWMVVEGIYQYLNYVVIIGAKNYKSCFMRRAGPVAWGLPILPVLGILLYDSKLYAHENDFCWMQLDAIYYTVLAPIATILLFNIVIFIGVLKSVLCLRMRAGIRTSQSVQTRSWYQFRMAVCIFFLLGLAWIFGFGVIFTSNDTRLIFEYLFCILNSLQGLAIFIFFVLRERNARKLWFDFAHNLGGDKFVSTSKTRQSRSTDRAQIKPNSKY